MAHQTWEVKDSSKRQSIPDHELFRPQDKVHDTRKINSKHSAETISCMLMNDMSDILLHSCRHALETLKASNIDVSERSHHWRGGKMQFFET